MTSALILTSLLLIVSSRYIYKTSGNVTISNVPCRDDHGCERHGKIYTWCYTDCDDNWDYCCDTPCEYDDQNALRCKSGTYDKFCGSPGMISALGKTCVDRSPCGHHGSHGYWCYTDKDHKSWDYCCHPGASCSSRLGYSDRVCNAGFYKESGGYWNPCKPA